MGDREHGLWDWDFHSDVTLDKLSEDTFSFCKVSLNIPVLQTH